MLRRDVIISFCLLISFKDTHNIPVKSPVCLMHPTYRPHTPQTKSCNPIPKHIKARPDSFFCAQSWMTLTDVNVALTDAPGFLTRKDDPDLITEDDLANPWTLASLFMRLTGEYLRWLMDHGFLQSVVTCGNPNFDLPCTLQVSLALCCLCLFFIKSQQWKFVFLTWFIEISGKLALGPHSIQSCVRTDIPIPIV